MAQKPKLNIGIDLGTTFSSIAVYNQQTGQYECLTDQTGRDAIPSWVSFSNMVEDDIKVGFAAKEDPEIQYVVHDAKRIIGREYKDVSEKWKNEWKFEVLNNGKGDPLIETYVTIRSGIDKFHPEEISAIILRHMLNIFKYRRSHCEIGEIVVTVPAKFSEKQRKATETACRLAGIEKVTLLNEPSAAILDYRRLYGDKNENLIEGSRILVIDFGGGTLDINCCELKGNDVEVIRNDGDENFGGNDFDLIMKNLIKQKIIEEFDLEDYYTLPKNAAKKQKDEYAKREGRLRKEAEIAKIELSKKQNYKIDLYNIFKGNEKDDDISDIIDDELIVTRTEFEEAIQNPIENSSSGKSHSKHKKGKKSGNNNLIERFENKVYKCASKAGFTKGNVDLVLLIGGTSQIPIIQRSLKKMFDATPYADESFDPMKAVAKGACFYADNFAGRTITQVSLYETIPYHVGLEVQNQKFLPVVLEGARLPETKDATVSADGRQMNIELSIYTGEDKMFVDSEGMKKETSFKVSGLPPIENISFRIELTVKEDGMLNVVAKSIGLDDEVGGELLNHQMDIRPIDREFVRIGQHLKDYYPPPLV